MKSGSWFIRELDAMLQPSKCWKAIFELRHAGSQASRTCQGKVSGSCGTTMNKRKALQHFILLATCGLSPKSALLGGTPDTASVLRIWGPRVDETLSNPLLAVLTKLEADYRQTHPGVTFIHHLKGNDSALGGLYVGAADLALMDYKRRAMACRFGAASHQWHPEWLHAWYGLLIAI